MRFRFLPVTFLLLLLLCSTAEAQRWSAKDPLQIPVQAKRDIVPDRYIAYEVEPEILKQILSTAPDELTHSFQQSNTLLTVGLADGTTDVFRMVSYSMMENELSTEFPEMKTYRGISTTNPYRTIRADWTLNGFRAVIRDLSGKTYIDPFQRNDLNHCIAYFKKDYSSSYEWSCGVVSESSGVNSPNQRVGDCTFRSYRLAQAANGEYCNYFGATSVAHVGIVMSEVITAINRVNEVYEADVSVRLILVANTDTLFFYNPSTDPYTNGNGSTMLGQNQTTCDARIGTANYDIGHVFSTGGGGVAYLQSVCNSNKAGGVTGQPNPVGDPFYIDYVAHEMGHQFGGNHTQNNACNRNAATAMEPGSASTIMGYAGICAPNVQNNSDDYFHGVNLQEISAHVIAENCEVVISTANDPPVVANLLNYTIPISTPFVLTASATDPDNDPLTYCWEQWDQEVGTMPPVSTNTLGPMFRSLLPTASPSRYFYNLTDLTNNVNPTWEELPSVARTMEFKVVVRDYYNNMYGCTDEDNTIITTTASSGPFTVTSQNSGATWMEGTNQTITWNVANTTTAPVSCANVEILMSYDGGFTYPTVLAASEPNDGSATISVPPGTTVDGRVMVKAVGNIFFDINNADITVEAGLPNFTIALNPAIVSECIDGAVQTTVNVGSFMGFTDPVTLSVLNAPAGSVVTFVPPIVIPGNSSILTISNLNTPGSFTPTVRGTSTTGNKDAVFTINLLTLPTPPSLTSPANNAQGVDTSPLLDWTSVSGSSQYEYQLATDMNMTMIVLSGTTAVDQFQITSPLGQNTRYFWRVRALNICGTGAWSSVFSFKTATCYSLMSTNVPITIPSMGQPTVYSNLTINNTILINDVNVIGLAGTHTWIDDLQFTVIAPNATEVLVLDQPCTNEDNFNINLDDEAASSNYPCPPTDGLTYKPSNMMTPFDGLASGGLWRMKIKDVHSQDGGSLNSWGLKVCGVCELYVSQITGTSVGSLPAALSCASAGDTIHLSASLAGQTINIGNGPLQIKSNIIIYADAPNISITTSGTRIFEVNSPGIVELNGMMLKAGTSLTGGAITNTGTLTLKNVTIKKNPGIAGATLIQNSSSGQIFMVGNTTIIQ